MITTDRDAKNLLLAIIENPDDDLPRLAYADWLEECGGESERVRAEFIRVQCELQRFRYAANVRSGEYDARDGVGPEWQRAFDLHDREMRILWSGHDQWHANWVEWCWCVSRDDEGRPQTLTERGGMVVTPHGSRGLGGHPPRCSTPTDEGLVNQEFRRGFIDAVRLPLAAARQHLPRIVREFPLTKAELTDRSPGGQGDDPYWFDSQHNVTGFDSSHHLPWDVYALLTGGEVVGNVRIYPCHAAAIDAASEAWLAWARAEKDR